MLGVVGQFRFFFGVQVIEIAKELVETVYGRQVLVSIAEMVLPELASGIAERLEHFTDGRVFRLKSDCGAGHTNLCQACAERVLPADKRCASSRTALLT